MSDDKNKVESKDSEVIEIRDLDSDVVELEQLDSEVIEIEKDPEILNETKKVGDDIDEESKPVKKRKKRRKKKIQEKKPKMEPEIDPEDEEVFEESGDSWVDDDGDNLFDDDIEKPKGRGLKIFLIVLASIVGILVAVYLGFALFFNSHFYFFTTVNGTSFSLKSEKYVKEYMEGQVADYKLTIVQKGDVKEDIAGSDIDLVYVENDDIKNAIKSQNPFLWPSAFFEKSSAEVKIDVSYDQDKLKSKLAELKCVTVVEQTAPKDAYPKYENGTYVIQPEVTGTKVDVDRLNEEANKFVSGFQNDLNMDEDNCYLLPKYTSESQEVKDACDKLNKYVKSEITYDMSPDKVVVDSDMISEWLKCSDDMKVSISKKKVKEYIQSLADKYDTVGKTRKFETPSGGSAEVSGGTYGWEINVDDETSALIKRIKKGKVDTYEPKYSQTAATHDATDWGDTYCEVDISAQHMWYVKDGKVELESDVVTGANYDNRSTPTGVYEILEKLNPTVLKGSNDPKTGKPKYETPVTYWMRVTWSGIGFHDATWQAAFGGSRYVSGFGSHGCINMPYSKAQELYGVLEMGTPVIIHQ